METIGKHLKRIREEQGLSIEQVTGKTRISPIYIRALEENRLDRFPGEVFARGFVRLYGHCLGLDEEETMTRFNESAEPFFRERDESKRTTEQSAELARNREVFKSRMIQFVVVAALGLSIVAVYVLNSRHINVAEEPGDLNPLAMSESGTEPSASERMLPMLTEPAVNKPALMENETPKPDTDQTPSPGPVAGPPGPTALETPAVPPKSPTVEVPAMAETPAVSPKKPAVETPATAEKASPPPKPPAPTPVKPEEELPLIVNVPGTRAPPSSPDGALVLVIEAVEAGWVSAKIDGGITKEVFLDPGEKVRWSASDNFLISFGNAGGVKIEFNGKPIPPFGPRGMVVKDVRISRQ